MRDAHTFELPYIFGHNGTDSLPDYRAISLSQTMIDYWTNFAVSGTPNETARSKRGIDGYAILAELQCTCSDSALAHE
jgi:carboxylesterase type B